MALLRKVDGDWILGESEIVNTRELTERLGVTRRTIGRWVKEGLPTVRYGRFNAHNVDEVMKWLDKRGYGNIEIIADWERKVSERKKQAKERKDG